MFRGGLVVKAHRLVYHSTLDWRVIKKREEENPGIRTPEARSRFLRAGLVSRRGIRRQEACAGRLPRKGNSNSHGARPVNIIISMIKRIRTCRLSIKNSLCWEVQKSTGRNGQFRRSGQCGPPPRLAPMRTRPVLRGQVASKDSSFFFSVLLASL